MNSKTEKINLTPEQSVIVNHDRGNILVSASAGSGKTHTMIERIKKLIIDKNVNVSEILAVTFTKMSAEDMKNKLRDALVKKMEEGGCDAKRLEQQISEIATADISTLHSFCSRLIRSYFFVAGVAPDYKIIEESEAEIMKRESIDKTFNEFYESGEEWFSAFLKKTGGKNDKRTKELVLKAHDFADSEVSPQDFLHKSLDFSTKEMLDKYIENKIFQMDTRLICERNNLKDILPVLETNGFFKGMESAEGLIKYVECILNEKDLYKRKVFIDNIPSAKFDSKPDEAGQELREIIKTAKKKIALILKDNLKIHTSYADDIMSADQNAQNIRNIIRLCTRFNEIYSEEKKEENALDFNDLEHITLKILADEDIRNNIREKYKYVFVDECQDINGVQNEIIENLSSDNLFMVGDNKQSIYGFRGCRPDLFVNKAIEMNKRGEVVTRLNHNYRSAKNIIDMVNDIFSYCMTTGYFGEDYKNLSKLNDGKIYPEDKRGRAELHFFQRSDGVDDYETLGKEENVRDLSSENEEEYSSKEEKPRIYDILEEIENVKENKKINVASLVAEIIDGELGKTYYDIKDKKEKQITYGDIAILTREINNTYIYNLITELRQYNIPVDSVVKVDIREFPEIQMLINILKLIDCFYDDIPLVSTLKSPLGQFTDEDLAEIACFYMDEHKRKSDEFYLAFQFFMDKGKGELREKVVNFKTYFDNIRYLADYLGAEGILEKIIEENHIKSYLLAKETGKIKINRVESFLLSAKEGDKKLTVREFLYKIANSTKAFDFSDGSDEDSVKAMTIHASKGLEFPVVIICGLERKFNIDDQKGRMLTDRESGINFKYFNDEKKTIEQSWITDSVKNKLKNESEREQMRLFYVATTRAKYSLHMIYEGKNDIRKSDFAGAERFMDFIPDFIPVTTHYESEFQFATMRKETRKVLIGKSDKNLENKIKGNINFNYPFVADTILPIKSSVTSALVNEEEKQYVHVVFDEDSPDTEKGIIAHKIMECYDFKGNMDFESQVKRIVDNGILTAEDVEKVNLERIKNIVTSGVFDSIKNCSLYREKSFLAFISAKLVFPNTESDGDVLVQGIIDLLVLDGENAKIIDYKYSSLTDDRLKLKYKKQLDLYASAVERVLHKNVTDKILINLFTGSVVREK